MDATGLTALVTELIAHRAWLAEREALEGLHPSLRSEIRATNCDLRRALEALGWTGGDAR